MKTRDSEVYHLTEKRRDELIKEKSEIRSRLKEARSRLGGTRPSKDGCNNTLRHATKEVSRLERRLNKIYEILQNHKIVDEDDRSEKKIVRLGSTVKLNFLGDGVHEYFLGLSDEQCFNTPCISPRTELAKTITGLEVGQKATYEGPEGEITVEVLEVRT